MDPNRTSEPAPPPLPYAPPAPPPIDYRAGGPEQKSQWFTDGDAYGAALVYLLFGLTVLGAIIGVLWWLVSWLLGLWLGW